MVNWVKRTTTIAVLVPLVFWIVSNETASKFLCMFWTVAPLYEFNTVVAPAIVRNAARGAGPAGAGGAAHVAPEWDFATLVGALMCLVSFTQSQANLTFALVCGIGALTAMHVVRYHVASAPPTFVTVMALVLQIFGIVYVAWTMSHANLLRGLPYGTGLQVIVLVVIWQVDNGAILTGSLFGERKFIPSVSPGKTWAGVLGGLALGATTAALMWHMAHSDWPLPGVFPPLSLFDYVVGAIGLGVLGVLGDLVESSLKRAAGVKDSGNLMPGHGGTLDRMDSTLVPMAGMYYAMAAVLAPAVTGA